MTTTSVRQYLNHQKQKRDSSAHHHHNQHQHATVAENGRELKKNHSTNDILDQNTRNKHSKMAQELRYEKTAREPKLRGRLIAQTNCSL